MPLIELQGEALTRFTGSGAFRVKVWEGRVYVSMGGAPGGVFVLDLDGTLTEVAAAEERARLLKRWLVDLDSPISDS